MHVLTEAQAARLAELNDAIDDAADDDADFYEAVTTKDEFLESLGLTAEDVETC